MRFRSGLRPGSVGELIQCSVDPLAALNEREKTRERLEKAGRKGRRERGRGKRGGRRNDFVPVGLLKSILITINKKATTRNVGQCPT